MNQLQNEKEIFEMIVHSGTARGIAFEALTAAEEYDFAKAEELMKQARYELALAHQTQTDLIQAELNGEPAEKTLLLIHAQDHFMTSMSEQKLIEHMIRILRKLKEETTDK
ncbi:PTS lactose/cellobiose transporter subunit IIA [Brevibacillus daliensis]|uniref:PTS lactose/cellobiose transporter subunit IIA n=1 Tax=Brevibacillus daliensis TaxID=2892995 RepID=UPI001E57D15D|nr:PTS lactose/cellobiose transporter subunit IIA [Brevibacillus daliensis]